MLIDSSQVTLIAVSGGVDSVVLCHLFKQAAFPFAIAHCNFSLRGQESDGDERFTCELAQMYQVPLHPIRFDTKTFSATHQLSIQMAARKLRYQFFEACIKEHGYHYIATAHHLDDSIETILLNFIKGSGIQGFYGIQPRRNNLIRPLLFANKAEIIAYATAENLQWREDSSNACNDYQRNLIRNKLVPVIQQINPNFVQTSKETAEKLIEIGKLFENYIEQIKKESLLHTPNLLHIKVANILPLPWASTILFEMTRPYGFTFRQIKQLLKNPIKSGKKIYSATYVLYQDRKTWLIGKQERIPAPSITEHIIYAHTPSISYNGNILLCKRVKCVEEAYTIPTQRYIAALDYHALQFPLMLRLWQEGDYFYPLGMHYHKKKISDFLIDLKVPVAIKDRILLLMMRDQVVWVVGFRIDERFKVQPSTKKVFESEWKQ